MSENRIRSFKNKGKDSSVSLCPELYVKHCLVDSFEKRAHSSNAPLCKLKHQTEFEVDRIGSYYFNFSFISLSVS